MALDTSGDVFIADTNNSRVVVDKPDGNGGYTQSVVDNAGLNGPQGVALDSSGDVFIADTGNNRVVEHAAPPRPTASFTAAQAAGSLTESFTDSSTAVSPATITGWSWSFGDNTSSSSQNPTHTYTAAGQYTVALTVTDSNGQTNTSSQQVTVNAIPTVTGVSPESGPTSGGTQITITGTGFAAGATVKIGQGKGAGANAIAATSVNVVSSTEITATTGGGAKAGGWNLYVTVGGQTSPANAGDTFTYAIAAPTVTRVSPASGPTSGGTPITITGTGFAAGATVRIGQGKGAGANAIAASNVTVVSSTKITATTGAGAKAGGWNLYVIVAGQTSPASAANKFTYTAATGGPSQTTRQAPAARQ